MAADISAAKDVSEVGVKRIYLDYAATTPLAPEALEAMMPWLSSEFGNPASLHAEGRRGKTAIDEVRETLSDAMGCLFAEVVFTSSGTEAANLAVLGAALANRDSRRKRILFGAAEHHCVIHTRPLLEQLGYRVEIVPVDRQAGVSPGAVEEALGDDVLLVSVMHANNEIGTINPIAEIAELARRAGALSHTDAVQTFLAEGMTPPASLGVDLASVSAHKVNGPKGVGALFQRAGVKLQPVAIGGGQEREIRAGTENVAGLAGFAAAVRVRRAQGAKIGAAPRAARDAFLAKLTEFAFVPTASDRDRVLPGHAHVRLPGVDAETMLIRLDRLGVSASSGAACSSGSLEPSHVLLACGYSQSEAREGLRFSFSTATTIEEAIEAAGRICEAAAAITKSKPGTHHL